MKVIHLGTKIESRFGLVDDQGNLVDNVTVAPDPNRKDDPLFINQLSDEAFNSALLTLIQTKNQLQQKTLNANN